MDMVSKSGKMAASTMANGAMTKPMVMEFSIMQMVIFMKGPGAMIKLMGMEPTSMQTEQRMQGSGLKINNTVEVSKSGLMEQNMRVTMKMERNMAKDA